MSALRPLPPRPNLEFEHRAAKALLRRLRAGDPDALARACAQHPAFDTSAPVRIRLADAQLVIAREYGFASWPRLVRYFGDLDRQRYNERTLQSHRRDFYDGSVRALLAQQRERRTWAARSLAAYVPRFYGMRADDIFASSVTEGDARLAVARGQGFPSWDVLLERVEEATRQRPDPWRADPVHSAQRASEAADLDALPPHELNVRLCGHLRMETDAVRHLLDRGADPNWMPPNGIPVLEHALMRYWNGEAVDVLAERVVPRTALWIAAGLGDVDGVRRSLDARGKPTREARRIRPDFDAVGPMLVPLHPDPDDDEILMEAFVIAMLNGRAAVLEYMVSRGYPVDTLIWGSPVINVVVGNAMTSMVECLVRCGADLDLRGWQPRQSARELAREMFENAVHDPDRRRIVELCGMDPDAILAERAARHSVP